MIGPRAPDPGFRALSGNPFPFENDPSALQTTVHPTVKINQPQDNSTTHVTVVDRVGNIVSYTSTIEFIGGSGMVVPGYGFLLNNELTDFDLIPAHPNRPEPGKRPRSSMSPTIMFAPNGRIVAFGSPRVLALSRLYWGLVSIRSTLGCLCLMRSPLPASPSAMGA